MEKKVLTEAQMREYVEQEVRKALMNENMDEGLLSGLLGGVLGNGIKSPSLEAIIGGVLGNIAIAPILSKLLTALGIPVDGAFGKFVLETAITAGGAKLGDWIDKKWDPIGVDNILGGRRPQQNVPLVKE